VSISLTFYAHIFRTKIMAPKFQTQKPALYEILAPKMHFRTKNSRAKRWWNWPKVLLISSSSTTYKIKYHPIRTFAMSEHMVNKLNKYWIYKFNRFTNIMRAEVIVKEHLHHRFLTWGPRSLKSEAWSILQITV